MKIFITLFSIIYYVSILSSFSQEQDKTKNVYSGKEARITDEINLSEDDIEVFKEVTRQKVDELQQHIITIGDNSNPPDKRDIAEREALKLFYKGAIMEISSVLPNGEVKIISRTMEKYLSRLKALPYTRVVIKFYDIAYVRDFVKGPDGKYYTTATIFQEFTGFTGDNIVYTDITKKEIEIVIDLVEDEFYNEKRWKIFLGDIKATETKKA